MGRSATTIEFYEAKLRVPGDRIDSKGSKKEGGKTFSRHYSATDAQAAKRRANGYAKKFHTVVVSVARVHAEDVIGRSGDWDLQKLITPVPPVVRKRDVILENRTLDEIVFTRRTR